MYRKLIIEFKEFLQFLCIVEFENKTKFNETLILCIGHNISTAQLTTGTGNYTKADQRGRSSVLGIGSVETSGFLLLADAEAYAVVNSCFYHGFLFAGDCQGYQSLSTGLGLSSSQLTIELVANKRFLKFLLSKARKYISSNFKVGKMCEFSYSPWAMELEFDRRKC